VDKAFGSVITIEKSAVSPFAREDILHFVQEFPKLACTIFWTTAVEETILSEHIVSLGKRSAYERIAALVIELLNRLQWVGLAQENAYTFPLTQELIADALGLSKIHVNRTLRRLRAAGLVTVTKRQIVIHDLPALRAIADAEE